MPNVDQALIELVKNSFDADATVCTVRIDGAKSSNLTIRVEDNGAGMSAEDMRDKWLLIGSSSKARDSRTRRFGRVPVGDKGLGRLAALRLGSTAIVASKRDGSEAAEVEIDWATYQSAGTVDEVELDIRKSARVRRGLAITIEAVHPMGDQQISRIARSLALISDPFSSDGRFRVRLLGTRIDQQMRRAVEKRMFPYARYRLSAKYDGRDTLSMRLFRRNKLWKRKDEKYDFHTVPFTFELWMFILGGTSLSADQMPVGEIRQWLSIFGGVHLFDGPIRIAPAGDRPVDWLDMNLSRVSSPEERPSTNNSIGRVILDNSSGLIKQTTDRVSFVENRAHDGLVAACKAVLKWASTERMKQAEKDRQTKRKDAPATQQAQTNALTQLRVGLSPEQLRVIRPAVEAAFTEAKREVAILREDNKLYRTMATAGITATVFAHELGQALDVLRRRVPTISQAIKKAGLDVGNALELVEAASRRLGSYISLPGLFASSVRRKATTADLNRVLREALDAFRAVVEEDKITVTLDASSGNTDVKASRAMLEAIIANLVTNSIQAFARGLSRPLIRQIAVKTRVDGSQIVVEFQDNAGGITGIAVDDIWLPGESTRPGGTGFGLTIVRDTVTDLNGEITVKPKTRFGGACFTLKLPRS